MIPQETNSAHVLSRKLWILFFLVFLFELLATASEATTLQIRVEGVIGPGTYDYIQRSLQHAGSRNADSVLMLINTPGGNLQSTRLIVEAILGSKIPFLCLIHPSGGHAGSAGAIILQACHVSGGVEATNIGAATPVSVEGDIGKDMRNKVMNDTVSWVEGLTNLRGRNRDFGKKIVTEAKAVTSSEAVKMGALDIDAVSIEDFLKKATGRKVKVLQNEVLIQTSTIESFDPDLRYKALDLMTHPQVAYLMFMGSLALLYFEFTHPGFIAPGVAGAVGLVASLMSFHMLDVKWGGVALIILGLAFFILEMFVTSFGTLAIGGIISFTLGSLFLFDSEVGVLPLSTVLPTAIGLGAAILGVGYLALSARKVKAKNRDLVGEKGLVTRVQGEDRGTLEVHGEIWNFVSKDSLKERDMVLITRQEGLTLTVRKSS